MCARGTRSASRNTQICRTLAGGAEDTRHVDRVVHARHDVPESGRTAQPGRERLADHASVTETLKRVGVAGRRAELEVQARGRGQIHEIDAIAANGGDDRRKEPIGIERRRPDVPKIPVGRRPCVAARAGTKQDEQAQTGSRFRRRGGGGDRIDRIHEAS